MEMCAKEKGGKWCGGTVLGYDLVAVESLEGAKRRKTKLTINEKEAETVRFIFNEYGNGKGYKAITNQLNKLGYKTKKGKPSRVHDGEFPFTGILRCPKCGAGMVISRTTNKLADGTKKSIAYYACGSWKNKGAEVCISNSIRVEKANEYVFNKLSELLSNDKMVKTIGSNVNKERIRKVNPAKKELTRIDKELEKLDKKKGKLFEAYEDEVLTKEEFQARKNESTERVKKLEEEKAPLLVTLSDDIKEELPYEFIKSILENFSKVLTESTSREQQKKLLHMIISEITINDLRDIDSIKININDNLVNYLSKEEGVSIKETPSFFTLSNVGINTLNLYIVI